MKCLSMSFYKASDNKWYPPGKEFDCDVAEAIEAAKKGFIKIMETAAVIQPETRIIRGKRK